MPPDVPQGPHDDVSPLERLQERLYRQQAPVDFQAPTLKVTQEAPRPVQPWEKPPSKPRRKGLPLPVVFFFGALVFFILASSAAAAFILLGSRLVSNNNVTITVQGPTSISSGTAVPLNVTITNHNPAAITDTDITMDFPDGTRSADDVTQPLVRYINTFGTIAPGASVNQSVQAVLFGSANQTVTIPVTFEYHTANSDALFTKQQNFTFTITSAPLTLTVHSTNSVSSGQPVAIEVAVRSNAPTELDDIAIAAVFPPGFTPSGTSSTSGSFIPIGTLDPGQEKDVTVQGTLTGAQNSQVAFQFTVGTAATDGSQTIDVPYATQETDITVSQPFLETTLSINNSSANPLIVPSGQTISGIVSWMNSISSAITDGQISIQLSGDALNPKSVTTSNGFYNSSKSTIIFSSQTEPGLANLSPGDTGNGSFTLSTLTGNALNELNNPTIVLTVSVSGQNGDNGSQENLTNILTQTIQVATNLVLSSQIVHSVGPYPNSGPWPPVPNKATLYTVEWSITNSVNDVGGGTVTAILPPYVTFTGKVTPDDGSLTYNSSNNTVTWQIGDIPADTLKQPLQAAFQISFTPSASQSNTSPILIGNQTLVGTDRFTNTQVGNTVEALSTQTTSDPNYKPTFGNVGD